MFKKRLKGLLAMLLAGSIATTAIPITASAAISGNIYVVGGETVEPNNIETVLNNSYSEYLTTNNLWAIYGDITGGGPEYGSLIKTATGNKLAEELNYLHTNPSGIQYSNVEINYKHKVFVTTNDPATTTDLDVSGAADVYSFPHSVNFNTCGFVPTNDPLQEATWTVWYGMESGGHVYPGYATKSDNPTTITTDGTSIFVPVDIVKGLYNEPDRFFNGVTIIQLKNSYKTISLPVKNVFGEPEKDEEGNDIKISITYNSTGDIYGSGKFYLCYQDTNTNKISNNEMSTKTALWTEIDNFAKDNTITGFNPNNLYLLRKVTMNVNSKSQYEGEFTTKELFEYKHVNNNTTENPGLKYLYVDALADSIWRVAYISNWYFADKVHIDDAIMACLKENPKASMITFTEQTTIYVTGTTPTEVDNILSDKIKTSQILKDNGSLKTISELLAELAAQKQPESGKKYDLNGWQLWSTSLESGVILVEVQKIEFNTSGVTGVTADMFDKAGYYKYPVIYFPQVDNTPSNPGGSSGGSSSRPEPSYDPNKPTIDGEEKDWDDVAREIGKFSEGETKTIYLGRDKTIPADVIEAIKDSKAIITFRISTAFNWTVDGSKLTDGDIHDYDFSIEVITATGVEILRGDVGVGFKIGDISDGATLNINFKEGHEQEFANLYMKVDGELVFVDNVIIDENGAAIGLEVNKSGEYVVMLGKFSDRPGDMDNDGILNAKDSLAVLKDFLGLESGTNPLVSDVNNDGFINAKDALIILKKFLGIE